jgi:hypothetical protein
MKPGPASSWPFPRWWAWLAPLGYLLHFAEEALAGGGFVAWSRLHLSESFSDARFAAINAIALSIVVVLAAIASKKGREWLMLPPFAVLTLNGVLHAASSVATHSYSPGLVTGMLLYVPIGGFTLWRAARAVPRGILFGALGAGLIAHGVVSWIAFRG